MNDEASAVARGEASVSEEDAEEDLGIDEAARRASTLVEEITALSASLGARMRDEGVRSKERARALRHLNAASRGDGPERDHIETGIARAIETTNAAAERIDHACRLLIAQQRGMDEKHQKNSLDLERTSKRLESLRRVRPAYQDEYEKLEEELRVEYDRYVVLLRNKDYLESELSSFQQAAVERQKKADRAMKRMQKAFREEELRVLNGGSDRASSADPVRPARDADEESHADDSASSGSSSPRERDSFSESEEGSLSGPSSSGNESSIDVSESTGSLDSDSSSAF